MQDRLANYFFVHALSALYNENGVYVVAERAGFPIGIAESQIFNWTFRLSSFSSLLFPLESVVFL